MNAILIRHGETAANKTGHFQGSSDAPLNGKGLSQAKALARRLKSLDIQSIYSSPQKRAIQTAHPIAKSHDMDITEINGLRELDIGLLDGLDGQDLKDKYPTFLEQWKGNVGSLRMPGGESIVELQDRTWKAMQAIRLLHKRETVIVVSHNFAIQSILIKVLGMDLKNFRRIKQDLAAITEIVFTQDETILKSLNDQCHLHDDLR